MNQWWPDGYKLYLEYIDVQDRYKPSFKYISAQSLRKKT